MESKFIQHIQFSKEPAGGNLLLGEVVQFHAKEEVYNDNGQIDPEKVDQVARLGLNWYTRSKQGLFELAAPRHLPIGVDALPDEVKNNSLFTGRLLARLASVEKIPKAEKESQSISSNLSEEELFKSCVQLLENNQVYDAWQVLYIIQVI